MSNWLATDESDSIFTRYSTFIIFSIAAISALTLFVIFQPMIEDVTTEAPMIIPIMFIPTFIVGFLYGLKITERVMKPQSLEVLSGVELSRCFCSFLLLVVYSAR